MLSGPPSKIAVALFSGFQALDVFGPLDALNILSYTNPLELYLLSTTLDPVSTIPMKDAPKDIEVLLVPGGRGTRDLELTQPVVDFIEATFPSLRFLLTVCTGSALAARAGVLDGKNATSNKLSFEWVMTQGHNVKWVRHARWVQDGNILTSSGVSAGIDMIYAFIAGQYGEEAASKVATVSEYTRNTDSTNDPFDKAA
ncbi:DJ-1/PfpI family domain-containing protein [Trichoderma breve]|uniref:DJ-1/PfpI family domain-containing protein n=1 Tax=Trichoderma breve TaxID=2034170 RepID=A0A9W9BHY6_9HYPO|nr:DJ-1/PfpI family domain-containing protein [Trichoderma breve]KAJ4862589.1 DJ-1/PfpI family domain-containing protein [Trichoderma breve]